jgi:hypothetical protein
MAAENGGALIPYVHCNRNIALAFVLVFETIDLSPWYVSRPSMHIVGELMTACVDKEWRTRALSLPIV